jgi:hypothetical protein
MDSFLRAMSEHEPPYAGRDGPHRRGSGSGGVILAACAAAGLAAGSVFATALILDEPDARARIVALFDQTPIRTIADANLPRIKPMPAPEAVALAGVDRSPTGSVDMARVSPVLFGASLAKGQSLAALREAWRSIEPRLSSAGLRPLAMIRDIGRGHELTLVVGPFADATDAAALCPKLADAPPDCGPVPFSGQTLLDP